MENHEVVISGIAGKFPECRDVDALKEKLFSKSVLVKPDPNRQVPLQFSEVAIELCSGVVPDWDKFDNFFFGIPQVLAKNSDPLAGFMLEATWEAIIDAGVSPNSLKGHRVAVFVAPSISDSESLACTEGMPVEGAGMVGNSRAMLANRISYCFNFTGPSYSSDMSWVGTMMSLDRAVNLVSSGIVEAAVVATANQSMYTSLDMEYRDLGFLAEDGRCQPFDANAHGFVRSSCAGAMFIQRRVDAKRIYGTVKKARTNFMGNQTGSYLQPDPNIDNFLRNFYNGLNEKPEDVSYIEAHGACIKESDEQELNAVANVFCSQKKTTQLVGSIYGNTGHCESCSGFVSMVKAILAMETGVIPPTVNYTTPNPNVPGLLDGRIKPVTEETALPGDLVAVNNITCYGGCGHVLLQRNGKTKEAVAAGALPADGLPRLVLLQARHEDAARAVCDKVSSMNVDVEFVSLVNDAFSLPIAAYLWRGFTIVPALKETGTQKIQEFNPKKRPLWFVFSGMGSQWSGMGRELLKIPSFASSIHRCDKVLRPKGIDIFHILSTSDTDVFDNILDSFVGITAIQIGLVDILTAVKITPDGIIGHSVGELGCAYADGCFTAEETILAAYARGKASLDYQTSDEYTKGMMAAVGLGYNDIKEKLPPTIDIACHNSKDSCTISGPKEDVVRFVEELTKEGVFARAVNSGGIAYHSRYIRPMAPRLLEALKQIVPVNKARSSKWVCTSVPESQWDTEAVKLCSPEYHTNNLINSVYFEESCKYLSKKAILLEIAPHGLLQAILRRSADQDSLNLSMTSRTASSNLYHLHRTLGELYLNNVDMNINALYPAVEYPVSRGTPSLASLATWDHEETHYIELQNFVNMHYMAGTLEKFTKIHLTSPEYRVWKHHRIAGRIVLPIAQVLMYPWEMILLSKRKKIEQDFTIIEDVAIKSHFFVDDLDRELGTSYSKITLKFEVANVVNEPKRSSTNVLNGRFVLSPENKSPLLVPPELEDLSGLEEMSESEIYATLSELGWHLGPQFQVIKQLYIGKKYCVARVRWTGNLIAFLESLFKIVVIVESQEKGILLHPNAFCKLSIDMPYLSSLPTGMELQVHYDPSSNKVLCRGAELLGLSLTPALMHNDATGLFWSELKFAPYFDNKSTIEEFLSESVQIAAEGGLQSWKETPCTINILVLRTDEESSYQYTQMLKTNFMSRSDIQLKIARVDLEKAKVQIDQLGLESVIVAGELEALAGLARTSGDNVYLISHLGCQTAHVPKTLRSLLTYQTKTGKLTLLKKIATQGNVQEFKIQSSEWLKILRRIVGDNNDGVIIVVAGNQSPRQVLPLIAKEPFADRIRTVFIQDRDAPVFSLSSSFYSSQLSLGLSVNILNRGLFGSLRSTSLQVGPCKYNLDNLVTSLNENLSINCIGLNTTNFTSGSESPIDEPELEFVDYSGMQKGQRVMGVGYIEPESNALRPDPVLQWTVPPDWTMEEAATAPVLYTLAYYCLKLRADIEEGERVLVHAGMSPFGQVAIAVASQLGAQVMASVLDEQEALTLPQLIPTLKSSDVFVLDGEDINAAVKKRTKGKGFEVIVNCLRGNGLQSTLKVAAENCRVFHFAEIKIEDKEIIGLNIFFGNRYFFGINLNSIKGCSDEWKTNLQNAMKNGIKQGVVKPLRKKLFRLRELSDALRYFQPGKGTEKTVLISKYEDQILPMNGYFQCNLDNLHIIAGDNTELKFDLVEWLIHHGARKLVLLNDQANKKGHYLKRINRILHRNKCSTVISPSSRLDTIESSIQFLKETLRIGTVSSIFCVCMDENSDKMKNLDLASRQLLPRLQQFVSLLGDGTEVSDSRASSGLPTCSIKKESSLESPAKILPYLFSLLTESETKAKLYYVSDNLTTSKIQGETDVLSYLPSSVKELHALGGCVEEVPRFTEVLTRSPGYSVVKSNLLPVFVVPGLGTHSLRPLLSQLINPAYCCGLPADTLHDDELADSLVQEMLAIQRRGVFNVVGESWGGALALRMARLLEARGHCVNLMLIQGIPTVAQHRLRALCTKYSDGTDTGHCILNVAFSSKLKGDRSWTERLEELLQTLEPDVRESVFKGVNSLNNRLSSFLQLEPPKDRFKGSVLLIRNKTELLSDLENLSKFCQAPPKIVTIEENDYRQLVASPAAAAAVNEHAGFEWRP